MKTAKRRSMRWLAQVALASLVLAGSLYAAAGDGEWLRKVPPKDRGRTNPYATDPDGPAAGAKIFAEHCASCHGEAAEGKADKKHPRPTCTPTASNRPRPENSSGSSPTGARKTACLPGASSPTRSAGN